MHIIHHNKTVTSGENPDLLPVSIMLNIIYTHTHIYIYIYMHMHMHMHMHLIFINQTNTDIWR